MKKFVAVTALLAVLASATAQDKITKKEDARKPSEPAPVIVKTQLPRGWKALGLTDKQKKEILTTRARFAARRQALEEQIKALRAEEMTALEKLLTDAQKQRLSELKK